MNKTKVAIIGPGNIGTDLMIKLMRNAQHLEMCAMVGIDPQSEGLNRASQFGFYTVDNGLQGLVSHACWQDIKIIFDATSAKAHYGHWDIIKDFPDKRIIDLTPAAIGPYLVPTVNFDESHNVRNVNMVTCGGQATIPMVAAVNQVAKVHYGEIVASISSKSAGPGTRANIDEFTQTTARAIESIGGAEKGKAIIILNPADPPVVMRDTIFTLSDEADRSAIIASVQSMVEDVQSYVPGYSLHQEVQFESIPEAQAVYIEGLGKRYGLKTTILLKVEGAGHYLPPYAGNLDIMTSAALATAEKFVQNLN